MSEPTATPLRCACCGLPWATLADGWLVVESRHRGEVHVNRISVVALASMAGDGAMEDPGFPTAFGK